MKPQTIKIADYTYSLPDDRIAAFPLEERDQSKLLVYKSGRIEDHIFKEVVHQISPFHTLVLNNTRVIEARLLFQKPTGGSIEIFCLEPYEQTLTAAMHQQGPAIWRCLIGGASKWKNGQVLTKEIEWNGQSISVAARFLSKENDSFLIEFQWEPSELSFVQMLHAAGAIPLPPYIKRKPSVTDQERYQTVFSEAEGSVAAPTAALHFTSAVMQELEQNQVSLSYVTLHVGAGTFKPVKAETMEGHDMHSEPFSIKKQTLIELIDSENILAVGTTSLRTLESLHWIAIKVMHELADEGLILHQWECYELEKKYHHISYRQSFGGLLEWMNQQLIDEIHCRTSLIIVPGYSFKVPVGLITNFHQPQSTLLLLIAAFIGEDWKKVYAHALENQYRFLSYGDSSLLWRS
ncbi:MAG TPA: S-adenosylmethionine:tRNA ribosyltransferase-isomerase [Flavisolibacter sp.]|jgi:S-adenosylmethionine:tRNA ribosyltransferase-isomerase|nr:S-adenosylmethionine:tRNA ribosyltransferase-isomerase [Flavisolibacter sp.]